MKCLSALIALMLAFPAAAMDKPRDWQAPPVASIPNHREDWRNVVMELSAYAKGRNKDFVVLVRGGTELVVKGERETQWEELRDPNGKTFEKRLPLRTVFRPYLKTLDGLVLDGLYCGPDALGKPLDKAIRERLDLDATLAEERARGIQRPPVPTPFGPFSLDPREELRKAAEIRRMAEREERQRRQLYAVDAMRQLGRRILSIESCKTQKDVDAAYKGSEHDRVLTYAGVETDNLNTLPKGHPRGENAQPVTTITAAKNWLPLLRADRFGTKAEWVMSMEKTNQDVLFIDVAHRGTDALTKEDVKRLKYKEMGAPRLMLAVLPVGKAYDGRWYWQKGWEAGNPPFLFAPIPEEPGSFVTDMADPKWKELLGKYLAGIMDLGFDGVVLDNLDTYLWFEELMPLEG
ncbi:MAG: hypothetical protein H7Y60_18835 [Rhodospirillaceae bacterium]|nr:hypothetical protein [Rhodospirillales bacterium]